MTPRGIRNCNPGNIREPKSDKTQWQGERATDDDKSFEEFDTMEHGIRALMVILRTYMKRHGLITIRQIIHRWAPPNENNTTAYINTVAKRTGAGPDEVLFFDKETVHKLVEAICFVENGGSYITNEQINRAWGLL